MGNAIWEKYKTSDSDHSLDDVFRRVARCISKGDILLEKEFYELMSTMKFVSGGRILAYAGTQSEKATLANCYVMGKIEDSMEGIMEALQESALTMKAGGGIGLDFSSLRPYGAMVQGTISIASGPVSFMEMWNAMSRTISGVGARKGAMIAVLRCDHPDIEMFIEAKKDNSVKNPVLEKFNISVAITEAFIKAVKEDKDWDLVFGGKVYKTVRAKDLWRKIIENNWLKAEPGVVFIDRINEMNNLYYCEEITATNPCGEQPLPSYGACTLGAINLAKFVIDPFTNNARIDLETLKMTVRMAVRFLDNTIDVNYYPIPKQEEEAKNKRRIGLGIMGLGSMLAMIRVRYSSSESLRVIEEVMSVIRDTAYMTSVELAKELGSFPFFDKGYYLEGRFIKTLPEYIRNEIKKHGIRNSHLLTIAPTGSISQLAGFVSSGVEPIYQLEYTRVNYGKEIIVRDYAYEEYLKSFKDSNVPDYFVTAYDLTPYDHIRVMAKCQEFVDSSISKTINVPNRTTIEELMDVYLFAHKMGLKGCTIYREGSLDQEILKRQTKPQRERKYKVEGFTYKVKPPDSKHAYYLTFNHERRDGRFVPLEFFINTKNPEHDEWAKALGRLVSAVFRNVEDPTFLADELKEIMGKTMFWSPQRRKFVPSIIAEFGEVMHDYFTDIGLIEPTPPVTAYTEIQKTNSPGYCSMCGQYGLVFEEGCVKCLACGYNKCG